ncbi:helix-turn-helix transcriptional regulator [Bacillus sp. ISL-7]|uniref:helix-turn-helix domain-containing protein n=1 Tax=Bacillus sp. ISL-7 TaxID=2819136 RepID=UPI001BE9C074|nr:helix-turn-helix transcriptional regulator [Bacillus sp. ISL-7]MBT2736139.1 helix-turn-helix transcriptional regulator [Bacillus sp. ISL-7]
MIKFKLNEVLNQKGKTMYWLSKTTGIRPNTISQWANNNALNLEDQVKSISVDNMDKICKALECNVEDLFQYEENE